MATLDYDKIKQTGLDRAKKKKLDEELELQEQQNRQEQERLKKIQEIRRSDDFKAILRELEELLVYLFETYSDLKLKEIGINVCRSDVYLSIGDNSQGLSFFPIGEHKMSTFLDSDIFLRTLQQFAGETRPYSWTAVSKEEVYEGRLLAEALTDGDLNVEFKVRTSYSHEKPMKTSPGFDVLFINIEPQEPSTLSPVAQLQIKQQLGIVEMYEYYKTEE